MFVVSPLRLTTVSVYLVHEPTVSFVTDCIQFKLPHKPGMAGLYWRGDSIITVPLLCFVFVFFFFTLIGHSRQLRTFHCSFSMI